MPVASFASVPALFLHRIDATPDAEAFYYPDQDENWQTLQWKDVGDRVELISCGLHSLGVQLEERCAILSATRIEWVLADFGILCAGGATTTIYPSNTAEECAFIIRDSSSKIVFAENDAQVEKILSIRDQVESVLHIINITGKTSADGFVLSLAELQERGKNWRQENPGTYRKTISSIQPHQLATLIYTSGTTGRPKGVELTQDCWVFEAEAMDSLGFLTPADKQFLWLPLAHSFGKVLEMATVRIGIPTAIDGRIDRIGQNLQEIQPTFVAAVPRIFEKLYNKIIAGAKEKGESSLKYRIFRWAQGIGQEVSALKQRGLEPRRMLKLKYAMADALVFKTVRNKLGGNLQFFISGSAPLSKEIATFFFGMGVFILEGYGLTESGAASFVNRPDEFQFGSVGKPLQGVEYKLAEDNEILLAGRGIMRGYYNLPDVTTDTLTDGWLHTGDIGKVDKRGFLRIVDRKKDLIKTSGGKYVAPQKLENKIKSLCPYVAHALVHGNARNFCTMLITIDEESIMRWADDAGLYNIPYQELVKKDHISQIIQPYINLLNEGLASYETVKKFAILPAEFSVETGELTPSMKVKRKVVEQQYKHVLDGFYTSSLEKM